MEDGLPLSHVNSVLASSRGYLWLATYDGLVRFDGAAFTTFNASTNPELPTSRFVRLYEDDRGVIWATAEFDHVVSFDGDTFRVFSPPDEVRGAAMRRFHFDSVGVGRVSSTRGVFRIGESSLEPIEGTDVGRATGALFVDAGGATWLATDGNGALRWQRGETVPTRFDAPGTSFATSFAGGPNGDVYIGTGAGVTRVSEGVPTFLSAESDIGRVWGLLPLEGDTVLVASAAGLFDLIDDRLTRTNPDIASSGTPFVAKGPEGAHWLAWGPRLYRNEVLVYEGSVPFSGLTIDHEGSVWAAADGLHRFKPSVFDVIGSNQGAISNVYPIFEDSRGRVWVGSLGGIGFFEDGVWNAQELSLSSLHQTIAEGDDGAIWFGQLNYGGCVVRQLTCAVEDRFLRSRTIKALYRDRSGAMWVGTDLGVHRFKDGVWTHLTMEDGLPHDLVRVFLETSDGSIWLGTNGGGIARIRDGVIEALSETDGLSSNRVRALYESAPGVVWVGTEDAGLNRLSLPDPAAELSEAVIRVVRRSDGLFDDGIHSMVDDGRGRLWMNTNRGIFWVLLSELEEDGARIRSISYTQSDGLLNPEGNGGVQSAAIRSSDGRLWFAMQAGVAVVDPASIEPAEHELPVLLENLHVEGGRSIPLGGVPAARVRLEAGERNFRVDYTALSFLAPDNLRFQYRLAGFQDEWVDADNRRTAFFTNVPPGEYTFDARAMREDGVWHQPPGSLPLEIRPFFYETPLFQGGLTASLLLLAVGGIRVRDRRQRAREQKLETIVAERTATIEAQTNRLQAVDRAKSRFFANVSHEFRTPLTLTIGPLEDVVSGRHGAMPPEAAASIDMSLRNSRRLLKLVNQLMDVAKIEARAVELRASRSDLVPFVRGLMQAFEPHAERLGVGTRLELPNHSVPLYFDPDLMERVLMNLLSNAFKFTPHGGMVQVGLEERDPGWVTVFVRDSGPGIAEEQIPHLFDRFYQGSESRETSQPGSGIGLSLAKELVVLHGGRLEVESDPGFGSTFSVWLQTGSNHLSSTQVLDESPPLPGLDERVEEEAALLDSGERQAMRGPASPETGEGEDTEEQRRRELPVVLIVEDNQEVASYLREHFDDAFRCIEARNGAEALGLAREHYPDLIVSDVMMPKMDGFELLAELRSDHDLAYVPVLMLTARAGQEDKLEGLKAGASDYLTKPFDIEELRARIEGLLNQQRLLREHFRHEALVRPAVPETPTAAEQFLVKLREAIEENVSDEDFDVRALARAMSESRSSLYRHVHDLLGQSPSELLRSVRLERAASMLEAEAGSIQQIAYAVGFKSVSHFSRSFREQYGTPPSRYPTPDQSTD